MISNNQCESLIEDPIILDLMKYCRDDVGFKIAQDDHGNSLCGDLFFVFHFPYKDKTIKVLVERHGERIVRTGQIRPVEDLNDVHVGAFLNEIGNPSNEFLPGVITENVEGGSPKKFAVIRGDMEIDEEEPQRNKIRFLYTMLTLRQQLNEFPPDFFSPT